MMRGSYAAHQGTRLGHYVIEGPIGAGGMGEVYRAFDSRLDRPVAIKVISDRLAATPEFRDRLSREARVVAGLDHPHICALFDVGEHDGCSDLVMQYLEGRRCWQPVDRSSAATALMNSFGAPGPWTPDGRTLIYTRQTIQSGYDVWAFDTESRAARPVLETTSNERAPDGRFVIIRSNEAETAGTEIRVVLNWAEQLKRLAPK